MNLQKIAKLPNHRGKAKATLELMRKIPDEVVAILPLTLGHCCLESREMGNYAESEGFKRESRELAKKLDKVYYRNYTEMTGEII